MRRAKTRSMRTYSRPTWVKEPVSAEEELCPDRFRVVGSHSRYKLVCLLGKSVGVNVQFLTKHFNLAPPTANHHLNAPCSVNAVKSTEKERERICALNRDTHCFDECKIPY
mgnify:FL=1